VKDERRHARRCPRETRGTFERATKKSLNLKKREIKTKRLYERRKTKASRRRDEEKERREGGC